MIKLVFGTGNPGKMNVMRSHLKGLDIEIIGLKELDYAWPRVDESGNNPLENARIKALAYYHCCHKPVFSCDSGLYIEGLAPEQQPGVHVRNVHGKTLSDDEMVEHYAGIARNLGGQCVARYKNAICLVLNEDEIYECMSDDISGDAFLIVEEPHEMVAEGFPIDRLSVHIATGEYYNDMEDYDVCTSMSRGFQKFFKKAITTWIHTDTACI
ncbi:MAG: hypothetical protein H6Q59_1392 [Firmicutes bacterium]|nr:hypothetical protein [Bacillota bacterium]